MYREYIGSLLKVHGLCIASTKPMYQIKTRFLLLLTVLYKSFLRNFRSDNR